MKPLGSRSVPPFLSKRSEKSSGNLVHSSSKQEVVCSPVGFNSTALNFWTELSQLFVGGVEFWGSGFFFVIFFFFFASLLHLLDKRAGATSLVGFNGGQKTCCAARAQLRVDGAE